MQIQQGPKQGQVQELVQRDEKKGITSVRFKPQSEQEAKEMQAGRKAYAATINSQTGTVTSHYEKVDPKTNKVTGQWDVTTDNNGEIAAINHGNGTTTKAAANTVMLPDGRILTRISRGQGGDKEEAVKAEKQEFQKGKEPKAKDDAPKLDAKDKPPANKTTDTWQVYDPKTGQTTTLDAKVTLSKEGTVTISGADGKVETIESTGRQTTRQGYEPIRIVEAGDNPAGKPNTWNVEKQGDAYKLTLEGSGPPPTVLTGKINFNEDGSISVTSDSNPPKTKTQAPGAKPDVRKVTPAEKPASEDLLSKKGVAPTKVPKLEPGQHHALVRDQETGRVEIVARGSSDKLSPEQGTEDKRPGSGDRRILTSPNTPIPLDATQQAYRPPGYTGPLTVKVGQDGAILTYKPKEGKAEGELLSRKLTNGAETRYADGKLSYVRDSKGNEHYIHYNAQSGKMTHVSTDAAGKNVTDRADENGVLHQVRADKSLGKISNFTPDGSYGVETSWQLNRTNGKVDRVTNERGQVVAQLDSQGVLRERDVQTGKLGEKSAFSEYDDKSGARKTDSFTVKGVDLKTLTEQKITYRVGVDGREKLLAVTVNNPDKSVSIYKLGENGREVEVQRTNPDGSYFKADLKGNLIQTKDVYGNIRDFKSGDKAGDPPKEVWLTEKGKAPRLVEASRAEQDPRDPTGKKMVSVLREVTVDSTTDQKTFGGMVRYAANGTRMSEGGNPPGSTRFDFLDGRSVLTIAQDRIISDTNRFTEGKEARQSIADAKKSWDKVNTPKDLKEALDKAESVFWNRHATNDDRKAAVTALTNLSQSAFGKNDKQLAEKVKQYEQINNTLGVLEAKDPKAAAEALAKLRDQSAGQQTFRVGADKSKITETVLPDKSKIIQSVSPNNEKTIVGTDAAGKQTFQLKLDAQGNATFLQIADQKPFTATNGQPISRVVGASGRQEGVGGTVSFDEKTSQLVLTKQNGKDTATLTANGVETETKGDIKSVHFLPGSAASKDRAARVVANAEPTGTMAAQMLDKLTGVDKPGAAAVFDRTKAANNYIDRLNSSDPKVAQEALRELQGKLQPTFDQLANSKRVDVITRDINSNSSSETLVKALSDLRTEYSYNNSAALDGLMAVSNLMPKASFENAQPRDASIKWEKDGSGKVTEIKKGDITTSISYDSKTNEPVGFEMRNKQGKLLHQHTGKFEINEKTGDLIVTDRKSGLERTEHVYSQDGSLSSNVYNDAGLRVEQALNKLGADGQFQQFTTQYRYTLNQGGEYQVSAVQIDNDNRITERNEFASISALEANKPSITEQIQFKTVNGQQQEIHILKEFSTSEAGTTFGNVTKSFNPASRDTTITTSLTANGVTTDQKVVFNASGKASQFTRESGNTKLTFELNSAGSVSGVKQEEKVNGQWVEKKLDEKQTAQLLRIGQTTVDTLAQQHGIGSDTDKNKRDALDMSASSEKRQEAIKNLQEVAGTKTGQEQTDLNNLVKSYQAINKAFDVWKAAGGEGDKEIKTLSKEATQAAGGQKAIDRLADIATGATGDIDQTKSAQKALVELAKSDPSKQEQVMKALLSSINSRKSGDSGALDTLGQLAALGKGPVPSDVMTALKTGLESKSPLEQRAAINGLNSLLNSDKIHGSEYVDAVKNNLTPEVINAVRNGVDSAKQDGVRQHLLSSLGEKLQTATGRDFENVIEATVALGGVKALEQVNTRLTELGRGLTIERNKASASETTVKLNDNTTMRFAGDMLREVARSDGSSSWRSYHNGSLSGTAEELKVGKDGFVRVHRDSNYIVSRTDSRKATGQQIAEVVTKTQPAFSSPPQSASAKTAQALTDLQKLAGDGEKNETARRLIASFARDGSYDHGKLRVNDLIADLNGKNGHEMQQKALAEVQSRLGPALQQELGQATKQRGMESLGPFAKSNDFNKASVELASLVAAGDKDAIRMNNYSQFMQQVRGAERQIAETKPAGTEVSFKEGQLAEVRHEGAVTKINYRDGKPVSVDFVDAAGNKTHAEGNIDVNPRTGAVTVSERTGGPLSLARTDTSFSEGKIEKREYGENGLKFRSTTTSTKADAAGKQVAQTTTTDYTYFDSNKKPTDNPALARSAIGVTSDASGQTQLVQQFASAVAVELNKPLPSTSTAFSGVERNGPLQKETITVTSNLNPDRPQVIATINKTTNHETGERTLKEKSQLQRTEQEIVFDASGNATKFERKVGNDTYGFLLKEGKIEDVTKNGQRVTGTEAARLIGDGNKILDAAKANGGIKSYKDQLQTSFLEGANKEQRDQAFKDLTALYNRSTGAERERLRSTLDSYAVHKEVRNIADQLSSRDTAKEIENLTKTAERGGYSGIEGLAKIANGSSGDNIANARAAQQALVDLVKKQPQNADKFVNALLDAHKMAGADAAGALETIGKIAANHQVSAQTLENVRAALRQGLESKTPLEQRSAIRGMVDLATAGKLTQQDVSAISAAFQSNPSSDLVRGIQSLPDKKIGEGPDSKTIDGKDVKNQILKQAESMLLSSGHKREHAIEAVALLGGVENLKRNASKYGLWSVELGENKEHAIVKDSNGTTMSFIEQNGVMSLAIVDRKDGTGYERRADGGMVEHFDKNWHNSIERDADFKPVAIRTGAGRSQQELLAQSQFRTDSPDKELPQQRQSIAESLRSLEKLATGDPQNGIAPNKEAAFVLKQINTSMQFDKDMNGARTSEEQHRMLQDKAREFDTLAQKQKDSLHIDRIGITKESSLKDLEKAQPELARLANSGSKAAEQWLGWAQTQIKADELVKQTSQGVVGLSVLTDKSGGNDRVTEIKKGDVTITPIYKDGGNQPTAIEVRIPGQQDPVTIKPDGPVHIDQRTGVISFSKQAGEGGLAGVETKITPDGKIVTNTVDARGLRSEQIVRGVGQPADKYESKTTYEYIGRNGTPDSALDVASVIAETKNAQNQVVKREMFVSTAAVQADKPSFREVIVPAKDKGDGTSVQHHSFYNLTDRSGPKKVGEATRTENTAPGPAKGNVTVQNWMLEKGVRVEENAVFAADGTLKSYSGQVGEAKLDFPVTNGQISSVKFSNAEKLGVDPSNTDVQKAAIGRANFSISQLRDRFSIESPDSLENVKPTGPIGNLPPTGTLIIKEGTGYQSFNVKDGQILDGGGSKIGSISSNGDFKFGVGRTSGANIKNIEGAAFHGKVGDSRLDIVNEKTSGELTGVLRDATNKPYKVIAGNVFDGEKFVGHLDRNGAIKMPVRETYRNDGGKIFHGNTFVGHIDADGKLQASSQPGALPITRDKENTVKYGENYIGYYDKDPDKGGKFHLSTEKQFEKDSYANVRFTNATFEGTENGHRRSMVLTSDATNGKMFIPGADGRPVEHEVRMGMVINPTTGEQLGNLTAPTVSSDFSLTGGSLSYLAGGQVSLAELSGTSFQLQKVNTGDGLGTLQIQGVSLGPQQLLANGTVDPTKGGLLSIGQTQNTLAQRLQSAEGQLAEHEDSWNPKVRLDGTMDKLRKEIRENKLAIQWLQEDTQALMTGAFDRNSVSQLQSRFGLDQSYTGQDQQIKLQQMRMESSRVSLETLPSDTSKINGTVLVPSVGAPGKVEKFDIRKGEIFNSSGQVVGRIENRIDKDSGKVIQQGLLSMRDPNDPSKNLTSMGDLKGAVWKFEVPAGEGQTQKFTWVSVGAEKGGVLSLSDLKSRAEKETQYTEELSRAAGDTEKTLQAVAQSRRRQEAFNHVADAVAQNGITNAKQLDFLADGPKAHVRSDMVKEQDELQREKSERNKLPRAELPETMNGVEGRLRIGDQVWDIKDGQLYNKGDTNPVGELKPGYKVQFTNGQMIDLNHQSLVLLQWKGTDSETHNLIGTGPGGMTAGMGFQPGGLVDVKQMKAQANEVRQAAAEHNKKYFDERPAIHGFGNWLVKQDIPFSGSKGVEGGIDGTMDMLKEDLDRYNKQIDSMVQVYFGKSPAGTSEDKIYGGNYDPNNVPAGFNSDLFDKGYIKQEGIGRGRNSDLAQVGSDALNQQSGQIRELLARMGATASDFGDFSQMSLQMQQQLSESIQLVAITVATAGAGTVLTAAKGAQLTTRAAYAFAQLSVGAVAGGTASHFITSSESSHGLRHVGSGAIMGMTFAAGGALQTLKGVAAAEKAAQTATTFKAVRGTLASSFFMTGGFAAAEYVKTGKAEQFSAENLAIGTAAMFIAHGVGHGLGHMTDKAGTRLGQAIANTERGQQFLASRAGRVILGGQLDAQTGRYAANILGVAQKEAHAVANNLTTAVKQESQSFVARTIGSMANGYAYGSVSASGQAYHGEKARVAEQLGLLKKDEEGRLVGNSDLVSASSNLFSWANVGATMHESGLHATGSLGFAGLVGGVVSGTIQARIDAKQQARMQQESRFNRFMEEPVRSHVAEVIRHNQLQQDLRQQQADLGLKAPTQRGRGESLIDSSSGRQDAPKTEQQANVAPVTRESLEVSSKLLDQRSKDLEQRRQELRDKPSSPGNEKLLAQVEKQILDNLNERIDNKREQLNKAYEPWEDAISQREQRREMLQKEVQRLSTDERGMPIEASKLSQDAVTDIAELNRQIKALNGELEVARDLMRTHGVEKQMLKLSEELRTLEKGQSAEERLSLDGSKSQYQIDPNSGHLTKTFDVLKPGQEYQDGKTGIKIKIEGDQPVPQKVIHDFLNAADKLNAFQGVRPSELAFEFNPADSSAGGQDGYRIRVNTSKMGSQKAEFIYFHETGHIVDFEHQRRFESFQTRRQFQQNLSQDIMGPEMTQALVESFKDKGLTAEQAQRLQSELADKLSKTDWKERFNHANPKDAMHGKLAANEVFAEAQRLHALRQAEIAEGKNTHLSAAEHYKKLALENPLGRDMDRARMMSALGKTFEHLDSVFTEMNAQRQAARAADREAAKSGLKPNDSMDALARRFERTTSRESNEVFNEETKRIDGFDRDSYKETRRELYEKLKTLPSEEADLAGRLAGLQEAHELAEKLMTESQGKDLKDGVAAISLAAERELSAHDITVESKARQEMDQVQSKESLVHTPNDPADRASAPQVLRTKSPAQSGQQPTLPEAPKSLPRRMLESVRDWVSNKLVKISDARETRKLAREREPLVSARDAIADEIRQAREVFEDPPLEHMEKRLEQANEEISDNYNRRIGLIEKDAKPLRESVKRLSQENSREVDRIDRELQDKYTKEHGEDWNDNYSMRKEFEKEFQQATIKGEEKLQQEKERLSIYDAQIRLLEIAKAYDLGDIAKGDFKLRDVGRGGSAQKDNIDLHVIGEQPVNADVLFRIVDLLQQKASKPGLLEVANRPGSDVAGEYLASADKLYMNVTERILKLEKMGVQVNADIVNHLMNHELTHRHFRTDFQDLPKEVQQSIHSIYKSELAQSESFKELQKERLPQNATDKQRSQWEELVKKMHAGDPIDGTKDRSAYLHGLSETYAELGALHQFEKLLKTQLPSSLLNARGEVPFDLLLDLSSRIGQTDVDRANILRGFEQTYRKLQSDVFSKSDQQSQAQILRPQRTYNGEVISRNSGEALIIDPNKTQPVKSPDVAWDINRTDVDGRPLYQKIELSAEARSKIPNSGKDEFYKDTKTGRVYLQPDGKGTDLFLDLRLRVVPESAVREPSAAPSGRDATVRRPAQVTKEATLLQTNDAVRYEGKDATVVRTDNSSELLIYEPSRADTASTAITLSHGWQYDLHEGQARYERLNFRGLDGKVPAEKFYLDHKTGEFFKVSKDVRLPANELVKIDSKEHSDRITSREKSAGEKAADVVEQRQKEAAELERKLTIPTLEKALEAKDLVITQESIPEMEQRELIPELQNLTPEDLQVALEKLGVTDFESYERLAVTPQTREMVSLQVEGTGDVKFLVPKDYLDTMETVRELRQKAAAGDKEAQRELDTGKDSKGREYSQVILVEDVVPHLQELAGAGRNIKEIVLSDKANPYDAWHALDYYQNKLVKELGLFEYANERFQSAATAHDSTRITFYPQEAAHRAQLGQVAKHEVSHLIQSDPAMQKLWDAFRSAAEIENGGGTKGQRGFFERDYARVNDAEDWAVLGEVFQGKDGERWSNTSGAQRLTRMVEAVRGTDSAHKVLIMAKAFEQVLKNVETSGEKLNEHEQRVHDVLKERVKYVQKELTETARQDLIQKLADPKLGGVESERVMSVLKEIGTQSDAKTLTDRLVQSQDPTVKHRLARTASSLGGAEYADKAIDLATRLSNTPENTRTVKTLLDSAFETYESAKLPPRKTEAILIELSHHDGAVRDWAVDKILSKGWEFGKAQADLLSRLESGELLTLMKDGGLKTDYDLLYTASLMGDAARQEKTFESIVKQLKQQGNPEKLGDYLLSFITEEIEDLGALAVKELKNNPPKDAATLEKLEKIANRSYDLFSQDAADITELAAKSQPPSAPIPASARDSGDLKAGDKVTFEGKRATVIGKTETGDTVLLQQARALSTEGTADIVPEKLNDTTRYQRLNVKAQDGSDTQYYRDLRHDPTDLMSVEKYFKIVNTGTAENPQLSRFPAPEIVETSPAKLNAPKTQSGNSNTVVSKTTDVISVDLSIPREEFVRNNMRVQTRQYGDGVEISIPQKASGEGTWNEPQDIRLFSVGGKDYGLIRDRGWFFIHNARSTGEVGDVKGHITITNIADKAAIDRHLIPLLHDALNGVKGSEAERLGLTGLLLDAKLKDPLYREARHSDQQNDARLKKEGESGTGPGGQDAKDYTLYAKSQADIEKAAKIIDRYLKGKGLSLDPSVKTGNVSDLVRLSESNRVSVDRDKWPLTTSKEAPFVPMLEAKSKLLHESLAKYQGAIAQDGKLTERGLELAAQVYKTSKDNLRYNESGKLELRQFEGASIDADLGRAIHEKYSSSLDTNGKLTAEGLKQLAKDAGIAEGQVGYDVYGKLMFRSALDVPLADEVKMYVDEAYAVRDGNQKTGRSALYALYDSVHTDKGLDMRDPSQYIGRQERSGQPPDSRLGSPARPSVSEGNAGLKAPRLKALDENMHGKYVRHPGDGEVHADYVSKEISDLLAQQGWDVVKTAKHSAADKQHMDLILHKHGTNEWLPLDVSLRNKHQDFSLKVDSLEFQNNKGKIELTPESRQRLQAFLEQYVAENAGLAKSLSTVKPPDAVKADVTAKTKEIERFLKEVSAAARAEGRLNERQVLTRMSGDSGPLEHARGEQLASDAAKLALKRFIEQGNPSTTQSNQLTQKTIKVGSNGELTYTSPETRTDGKQQTYQAGQLKDIIRDTIQEYFAKNLDPKANQLSDLKPGLNTEETQRITELYNTWKSLENSRSGLERLETRRARGNDLNNLQGQATAFEQKLQNDSQQVLRTIHEYAPETHPDLRAALAREEAQGLKSRDAESASKISPNSDSEALLKEAIKEVDRSLFNKTSTQQVKDLVTDLLNTGDPAKDPIANVLSRASVVQDSKDSVTVSMKVTGKVRNSDISELIFKENGREVKVLRINPKNDKVVLHGGREVSQDKLEISKDLTNKILATDRLNGKLILRDQSTVDLSKVNIEVKARSAEAAVRELVKLERDLSRNERRGGAPLADVKTNDIKQTEELIKRIRNAEDLSGD